jgi:protein arginine N-methyltransferase 7
MYCFGSVCNLLIPKVFQGACCNLRRMSVFTAKINPITGKSEWELQNEDYDYHQEIARSAFADMLHDTERVRRAPLC